VQSESILYEGASAEVTGPLASFANGAERESKLDIYTRVKQAAKDHTAQARLLDKRLHKAL